jgi:transposase
MKKADRIEMRHAIKAYLNEGHSESEVATLVPCNVRTVKKWKKEIEAGNSLEDKSRRGRPRVPEVTRTVVAEHSALKRNRSTRATARWLEEEKHIKISRSTVANILHEAGLQSYKRQKKPKLTETMKQKRIKFAKKYSKHKWNRTLMTDETDFTLDEKFNPQNDRVWAHSPEEVPPIEQMAHPSKLRVWGGVSALGTTKFHFYQGNLDGSKYKKNSQKIIARNEGDFWTKEMVVSTRRSYSAYGK